MIVPQNLRVMRKIMLNGTQNNIFALIPTIQRLAEPFLIEIFQKFKRFKKIQSFFYRNDLEEIKN